MSDYIDHQAELKSCWINVKNKIPKRKELVLVFVRYHMRFPKKEINRKLVAVSFLKEDGTWDQLNSQGYTVTHWMRIPDFPEED